MTDVVFEAKGSNSDPLSSGEDTSIRNIAVSSESWILRPERQDRSQPNSGLCTFSSTTMSPSSYNDYLAQLKLVKSLAGCLPLTLPIATKNDKIFEVFENIPVPTDGSAHWKTFNRRFDILFGEDVRDLQGRLLHVTSGKSTWALQVSRMPRAVRIVRVVRVSRQ